MHLLALTALSSDYEENEHIHNPDIQSTDDD